jgi:hypothetical protein
LREHNGNGNPFPQRQGYKVFGSITIRSGLATLSLLAAIIRAGSQQQPFIGQLSRCSWRDEIDYDDSSRRSAIIVDGFSWTTASAAIGRSLSSPQSAASSNK